MFPQYNSQPHSLVPRLALLIVALACAFWLGLAQPSANSAAAQTLPRESAPLLLPNSLGLASFSVKLTKKLHALIAWETGTELEIYAFNVWRRTAKGAWGKLNAEPLLAAYVGQIMGSQYRLRDRQVKIGKTYFYQLELVTVHGYSSFSEQVKLKVK
jgi:hypothetical protein